MTNLDFIRTLSAEQLVKFIRWYEFGCSICCAYFRARYGCGDCDTGHALWLLQPFDESAVVWCSLSKMKPEMGVTDNV